MSPKVALMPVDLKPLLKVGHGLEEKTGEEIGENLDGKRMSNMKYF